MYSVVVGSKTSARLCLVLTLCSALLAYCSSPPEVVKVGLVAPFEGRYRDVGYDAVYAARLAVREANGDGGKRRVRVELVALDDSADVQLAEQVAASLVIDPDVVAVLGHWQEETTAAARVIYEQAGVPLLALGEAPFEPVEVEALPSDFRERYAAVTPFDEQAGAYAGATYDGFQLLLRALELAEMNGEISRESVAASLEGLQYHGVTGIVYGP
jgi:ABC-type branched-subunit amino acid transport system substrate-binding protein